jgi:hypothetical protein
MATQVTASLPSGFGKSGFGSSPTGPTDSGTILVDKITEFTAAAGVTIVSAATFSAAVTFSGGTAGAMSATTFTASGAITPSGGIKGVNGSLLTSCFCVHSGGVGTATAAAGTDSTAVNTETLIVEVFVPVTTTFTGVSVMHLATSTGNVQFAVADATGALVAASTTASTAAVAAAAYQQVPFSVALTLTGPATYFVLMQNSGSNHIRTHVVGNFRCGKKTGEVFGTFTAITPPTGFTTALGPILDLYV